MSKLITVLGFAAVTVLLAACSNEPSERDIHKAVEKQISEVNEGVGAIARALSGNRNAGPTGLEVKLTSVRKLGCKPDGDAASRCDVEIETSGGKRLGNVRLVKSSDGWVIPN